jgi:hypothetical protein
MYAQASTFASTPGASAARLANSTKYREIPPYRCHAKT